MGFRICVKALFGICLGAWRSLPKRQCSLIIIRYDPGFDDKMLPVYVCKVIGGDTEYPLQVCELRRSSESTHFRSLRRDVALLDSTRAPDGF